MEIIEKKVYEEGGENRRSTRERANAGLTLGIIGTVLGAAALWGRNNGGIGSILGGGTSLAGGGSVPSNVNINSYGGGATGCVAPTPFQAWEKGCEDAIALTNEMWRLKVGSMQAISDSREVDVAEKFGLYKTMVDADFLMLITSGVMFCITIVLSILSSSSRKSTSKDSRMSAIIGILLRLLNTLFLSSLSSSSTIALTLTLLLKPVLFKFSKSCCARIVPARSCLAMLSINLCLNFSSSVMFFNFYLSRLGESFNQTV